MSFHFGHTSRKASFGSAKERRVERMKRRNVLALDQRAAPARPTLECLTANAGGWVWLFSPQAKKKRSASAVFLAP